MIKVTRLEHKKILVSFHYSLTIIIKHLNVINFLESLLRKGTVFTPSTGMKGLKNALINVQFAILCIGVFTGVHTVRRIKNL